MFDSPPTDAIPFSHSLLFIVSVTLSHYTTDELDSYMYQTVGHMGITKLAEAMELPLYRMETKGQSIQKGKSYVPTDDDEVEDLFSLLKLTKDEMNVEAVAVGAIFSDYQRIRVENV